MIAVITRGCRRLRTAWPPGAWLLCAGLALLAPAAVAESLPLPELTARAAVVLNPVNNQLLYAREPHLRLPPASTTKVLTALVALERLNLNTPVTVGPNVLLVEPTRIGLQPGDVVLAQDLLYGLLLRSGNDAAETLAEAIGGSVAGFANLMNARALGLGARDSHFVNPHGLPAEDHYTTAYDLALIFRQAMNNPMFAEIVRTHNADLRVTGPGSPQNGWRLLSVHNTNRLLESYEGAQGGKTGFTRAARNCFVGEVVRNNIRLIVAVLGSGGRYAVWNDVRLLLDYGFSQYGLAPVMAATGSSHGTPSAPTLQGDDGE